MTMKRKRAVARDEEASVDLEVAESEPIDDRSSRFVGFFSPSIPPKELQDFVAIGSASHKILGWRRESNQQSLTKTKQYVSGHDDDGEQYGGKKVENVLKALNVTGACVVARWYGGILLGPVRFEHIEECAKDAVLKWQAHEAEERAKKRKLEDEALEQPKMAKLLSERDVSVEVLRTLAAEKEAAVKSVLDTHVPPTNDLGNGKPSTSNNQQVDGSSKPSKAVADYANMPLDRLKALEKARDATLAFLLKRIDKAEADLLKVQREST